MTATKIKNIYLTGNPNHITKSHKYKSPLFYEDFYIYDK